MNIQIKNISGKYAIDDNQARHIANMIFVNKDKKIVLDFRGVIVITFSYIRIIIFEIQKNKINFSYINTTEKVKERLEEIINLENCLNKYGTRKKYIFQNKVR